jgi:hypothetical protein
MTCFHVRVAAKGYRTEMLYAGPKSDFFHHTGQLLTLY